MTAFANAGGGDLIFGIEEDGQGQALSISPQMIVNWDEEIRRLQDILMHSVEAHMPGVKFHPVPVSVGGKTGYSLVIRVPQSWAGPHRVKTNQHFYVREGLRKRQLDIPEIRSLFLQSESQSQRVRDFRTERIGKILVGEAPHRLVDGPLLVVHLIPTQATRGLVQIDPVPYMNHRDLPIMGTRSGRARLNIDGALSVRTEQSNGETHGYSQFFRNGFFESTFVLTNRFNQGHIILHSGFYEKYLIALLDNFRSELKLLNLDPECAILVSLTRANETQLGVLDHWDTLESRQFDRNILILPDVVARSDVVSSQALRPVFDLMCQAAGLAGSRNFNAAGEWVPPG